MAGHYTFDQGQCGIEVRAIPTDLFWFFCRVDGFPVCAFARMTVHSDSNAETPLRKSVAALGKARSRYPASWNIGLGQKEARFGLSSFAHCIDPKL